MSALKVLSILFIISLVIIFSLYLGKSPAKEGYLRRADYQFDSLYPEITDEQGLIENQLPPSDDLTENGGSWMALEGIQSPKVTPKTDPFVGDISYLNY
jgi:hypothetical protein